MTLKDLCESRHLSGPEITKRKMLLDKYRRYDVIFWIYDGDGHLYDCVESFEKIEPLVKDMEKPSVFCVVKSKQVSTRIL